MKDNNLRKEEIDSIVEAYYKEHEFLHQEPLSFLTKKAEDTFLNTELSIEEIKIQLQEILKKIEEQINSRYQAENVGENHALVFQKLEEIIPLLNQSGIEYHLAGALSSYIAFGEESSRCHDDIDFLVNEKDLAKFGRICEDLGYTFYDHRMQSPRVLKDGIPCGEHEIIAILPNNDFHIGVFSFEHLIDGNIVIKGYYHDEEGNPCCREEIISSELASEVIETQYYPFHGLSISIVSPEYVYYLKQYTKNSKDMYDLEFLESRINKDKVEKIRSLTHKDRYIQCVSVEALPEERLLNPNALENDNTELSQMLVDSQKTSSSSEQIEEPKGYEKIRDVSFTQNGFVNRYAIVIALLSLTVITLIVLIAIKWMKLI